MKHSRTCEVIPTDHFLRELKPLARKYASLKDDLSKLLTSLEVDPTQGTPLGGELYKIRLAIGSKGKGKSGGARLITYFRNESTLYLLSIYDKSELDSLPLRTIRQLVRVILDDLDNEQV